MKRITLVFSVAAAAMLLGGSPAKAVRLNIGAVTPLDTFSFDIVGFSTDMYGNTVSSTFLTPQETATFDVSQTYTAADYDNQQNISITSGETVNPITMMTTDTFTVSTPTSFVSDASFNGVMTLSSLQFDLGDSTSGGNSISLALPITSYTASGSAIYNTNSTIPITNPTTMLGSSSYAAAEGVSSGSYTTAIASFDVHSFTYSITYASGVPEPSTWAMLGLGVVAVAAATRRRRTAA